MGIWLDSLSTVAWPGSPMPIVPRNPDPEPRLDRPPTGHPERLIPDVLPSAVEAALWAQLDRRATRRWRRTATNEGA